MERPTKPRATYCVELDTWANMKAALLLAIIEDAGSGRAAAKLLGVSRSTFGTWAKRARMTSASPAARQLSNASEATRPSASKLTTTR